MIARENVRDVLPLSPLQQGMLFHAESGGEAYHEQLAYRIDGPLDVDAFRRAWELVVARHDALRAAFVHRATARPVQVVLKSRPPEFTVIGDASLADVLRADRARPFDVERDPLMRVTLVRLGDDAHAVVWSYHHILLDGWCVPIILGEVLAAYRGDALDPAPPYSRYFEWLRERDETAAVAWFANELRGYESTASFPGPKRERSEHRFTFTRAESDALRALARQLNVTLPIVLEALWGVLLARHNHTRDVVFGTTVSGRPADVAGIERMVGLFINTIPLRVRFDEATTFRELATKLDERFRDSEAHHHAPLAAIQAAAGTPSLFDHLFVIESYPAGDRLTSLLTMGDPRITQLAAFEQTNYDAVVAVAPDDEIVVAFHGLRGDFPRLEERLRVLANAAAHDPDRRVIALPVITDCERSELLELGRGETLAIPHHSIVEAFATIAHRDEPAVIHGNETLTFRQVDHASNRIANFLIQEFRVQCGDRVLLDCGRTHHTIAALLGILKAGAAYVPLDPLAPPERARVIREDSGCVAVLTEDAVRRALAFASPDPPRVTLGPDDLAYVLYTSGSTGLPKGVLITHGNVLNLIHGLRRALPHLRDERTRLALFASLAFDASGQQLFATLVFGHPLVIVPEELKRDGRAAIELLVRHRITAIDVTPSLLSVLVEEGLDRAQELRTILCGGEVLTRALADRCARFTLVNVYGPTECCIDSTFHIAGDASEPIVPIGRPLANQRIYLLDDAGELVPRGAIGEICLAGAGVGRGYLNHPSARFGRDPFVDGARMYRTGDRGCWREDGQLEFLERMDTQVKLRGYRIELGEIEAALVRCAGVRDAVAVVRSDELDAAVTGVNIDVDAARNALARTLPPYMVPSRIVVLDAMPLTASGKTDRKWVAAEIASRAALLPRETPAPRNRIEARLAELVSEVLGETIAVDEDFFLSGGHSLKAMQLAARIRRELGIDAAARDVFTHPTISTLAAELISRKRASGTPIVPTPVARDYPLSHAQQRIWLTDRISGPSGTYNMPAAYVCGPGLDLARLRRCFTQLVARHEALRTNFVERGGHPRQVVRDAAEFDLDVIDLASHRDAEGMVRRIAADEAARPFDLERDRLLRATAMRVRDGRTVLIVVLHHIIGDGWSMQLLARELAELYADRTLPPLALQYRDFAAWEAAHDFSEDERWWRSLLSGDRAPKPLPLPSRGDSPTGSVEDLLVDGVAVERLRALAREHRTTLANVVLAAWSVLLAKTAGQSQLSIGITTANRAQHPELERIAGCFVNTLLMPVEVADGATLPELVAQIAERSLDAYDHQSYPFDRLVAAHGHTGRGLDRILNVNFAFQNFPDVSGGSLDVEGTLDLPVQQAKFDLGLAAAEEGDPLRLSLEYANRVFDADAARAHLETLRRFLETGELAPSAAAPIVHHDLTALRAVWRDILGTDDINPHDDFFEIGGHSLKALQLTAQIHERLGIEISVRDVFTHTTLASQAAHVATLERRTVRTIAKAPDAPHYPLSHAQMRLWLVEKLTGPSSTYNMSVAYVCDGAIDAAVLERCFTAIAARHESLRTNFVEIDGTPRQLIHSPQPFVLRVRDAAVDENAARGLVAEEAAVPFDLAKDPLVRAQLVPLTGGRALLLVTIHHIAGDGWSMQILGHELAALYDAFVHGEPDPLPPLPLQYRDYAVWEQSHHYDADERYWLTKLRGPIELVRLPREFGLGEEHRFAGGTESERVPDDVAEALRATAAAHHTTLANVILAVWAVFLRKLADQTPLAIAVSTANRSLAPDLERVVGFFVNAVVLRVDVDDDAEFDDVLRRVIADSLEALEHQSYPFDRLVERLRPAREGEDQPLFNVNYSFQSFSDLRLGERPRRESAIASLRPFEQPPVTAKFDLTLFALESEEGLVMSFEYARRLFRPASMRRYLAMFVRFLAVAAERAEVRS